MKVESSKFIVTLNKANHGLHWDSAEKLEAPSKPKRDWSKVNLDSDEEVKSSADVEAYFRELFANAPEDARKAMIKSYVSDI